MSMYCEKFFSQTFNGKNRKQTYLNACKWVANNILSKEKLKNTFIEYEKIKDSTSIKVNVYVYIRDEDVREQHCKICREMHNTAFMSEETNCAWCKIKGYQNRIDNKLMLKKEYYKLNI